MTLEEFIQNNDVEMTKNTVDASFIGLMTQVVGVVAGPQLEKYILSYGYLAFSFMEFYGINSLQDEKSDMIMQTVYLHKYFTKTEQYIALCNLAEGIYALIDSNDYVYEYDSVSGTIITLGVKLFDYITKKFEEIKFG